MMNDEGSPNVQMTKQGSERTRRHPDFVLPSSLVIGHSSVRSRLVATDAQLAELLKEIDAADRVALDTEADSLHSYREKLCLLQISVPVAAGSGDAAPDMESLSGNRDHRSR